MAVLVTAPAPAATPSRLVRVPGVIGMTESDAQCALAAAGLSWRYRGERRVLTQPMIPCTGMTFVAPDPLVTAQTPGRAVRVHRGAVIVLDDECLRHVRKHPQQPCL